MRAIKLKSMALTINGLGNEDQPGYTEPEAAIKQMLGENWLMLPSLPLSISKMNQCWKKIGLRRPALTGVDMNIFGLGPAGK